MSPDEEDDGIARIAGNAGNKDADAKRPINLRTSLRNGNADCNASKWLPPDRADAVVISAHLTNNTFSNLWWGGWLIYKYKYKYK